jgi:Uncharacterized small protein
LNKESKAVTHPVLEQILRALQEIRYGSIEITIHNSRIVQIECREKLRINDDGSRRGR